ncbi:helix-turn-helix domain-containing protein [Clostridium sp. SHJSY1]|uniref:helix-turn-helix domain-containing protein n=1 Tax=Clostridium sp. SHJSY1 TaxID=2942483 RepID=UPI0028760FA4|nr:helix-turn-helix transcriptional regulator [Clostridium sp. SHJSY1]MDS0527847.1 helix-turn-helix domain-containing protein [Clostridium sp. SHJSY1]
MNISTLGLNIKTLREKKGLSLNKLKEECGIGYATLHDIENGKSQNLNSNNLEKVAKALDTTVDELLNLETIEHTVSDIADTLDAIFKSDELKLDGIELNEYESDFLKDFFKAGIERIRKKRDESK